MYRVVTTFTGVQGSPWYNILHFLDDAGTAQQAVTAAGGFWGAVDANMNSSVSWATSAEVETVDPVTGDVTAVTNTTPVTGIGGGSGSTFQLPLAAQVVCKLRTGVFVAGREIRGRIFVPGYTETVNDSGLLTTAAEATINTALAALIADANSAVAVYSRTHARVEDVTSASASRNWAVLRSRRD